MPPIIPATHHTSEVHDAGWLYFRIHMSLRLIPHTGWAISAGRPHVHTCLHQNPLKRQRFKLNRQTFQFSRLAFRRCAVPNAMRSLESKSCFVVAAPVTTRGSHVCRVHTVYDSISDSSVGWLGNMLYGVHTHSHSHTAQYITRTLVRLCVSLPVFLFVRLFKAKR